MSIKNIVFLVSLSLFYGFSIQSGNENDRIYWDSQRKLEWSDFKGVPNTQSTYKANTAYHISYSSKINNDSVEIEITANFSKSKSWVEEGEGSEYLLRHEQIHFNIAEVYARLLRKKTTETKLYLFTINNEYPKIVSENLTKCKSEQAQYDTETDHSMNLKKQEEWENKVNNELKALESYRPTKVECRLFK